jgi:hypothetical protein
MSAVSSAVARPGGFSPGTSRDCGAFTGDGVLPDLADLYRCAIRRAVRVRVSHAIESRTEDVWSVNRRLSARTKTTRRSVRAAVSQRRV